jgi:hypothetical protein
MRIIKLLCLLFILSSCNKYLGVVESDYIPATELEDLFPNDIKKSNQTETSEINKIIYPSDNFNIGDISSAKIKKITSLEERSLINFVKDSIYFTKKDHLIILNLSDYKEVLKIKLNLDREEKIIKIFKHSNKNFIISNKSKLFTLENSEITLVANFDKFINDEIILNNEKLFIFTVFGELYEINLNNYELSFKSKFPVKHGVNIGSNNYNYKNQISHLFNSGTLIFLNQIENYDIENNYFLEDLNILSSLGYFEEFIDAPFGYNNYLYFIDRSGLISVFNPLESEFLWEVDVRSPISDYNFTEDGNLLLLLNNEVVIFDNFGNLIATLEHSNENPLKLVSDKDKILIIDEKGIDVLDLKSGSRINFFKNKFIGSVDYIHFNSNSYIKDNKVLYKFSE